MIQQNIKVIDAQVAANNYSSSAVDASQMYSCSLQLVPSGSGLAGTIKLQGSNDMPTQGNLSPFTPSNWSDIASASIALSSSSPVLIPVTNIAHQYVRAVYTSTATGVQTIVASADVAGATASLVIQGITLTAASAGPIGNLASITFTESGINTPFSISVVGNAVEVILATDGTGASLTQRAFIVAQLNLDAGVTALFTASGSGTTIIVGAALTNLAGGTSSLNSKYFLLDSANSGTGYYVWMSVDGDGTDPLIPGRTAVPVTFATGSTASTVGTAIKTAIDGLANFIATGTSTITVTNSASGPFVPMVDGDTGFTFAVTTPSGTITARLKSINV